jgi:hypothetical protein
MTMGSSDPSQTDGVQIREPMRTQRFYGDASRRRLPAKNPMSIARVWHSRDSGE